MNVERLRAIINELETPTLPVEFNMSIGSNITRVPIEDIHLCGTVCCVGGLACLMFGKRGEEITLEYGAELLELTEFESNAIFYNLNPYPYGISALVSISRQKAIQTLRRIADCGSVKARFI